MDRLVTSIVPPVRPWQTATVVGVRRETPNAKPFQLMLPGPHDFLAGQHFIVRLMAADGYRAQRAYSAASAPGTDPLEITVELLAGGEVSAFLHERVEVGDTVEVRGPIGGHFTWEVSMPILGIAGGSGVVPLMSMVRAARAVGREELVTLVVSTRTPRELYYAQELVGEQTTVVYTREAPAGHLRAVGRLTDADLAAVVRPGQLPFVCGSPAFCDAATMLLDGLGVPSSHIRVERFGPSG
jgi:ferredoxin-NADP reductase